MPATATVHRTLPMTLKIPNEQEASITLEDHTQEFRAENLGELMKKVTAAMGRDVTSNGAEFLPVTLMDATAEEGIELAFGLVDRNGTITQDETPEPRTARKARVAFAKWSADVRDASLPAPETADGPSALPAPAEPSTAREEPVDDDAWAGLAPAVRERAPEVEPDGETRQDIALAELQRLPRLDYDNVPATQHDPTDYVEDEDFSVFRMKTLAEARQDPNLAHQGWQSKLNVFGLKLTPGKEERDFRADRKTLAEAEWDEPKHLVIANPKGGVLKTTTTSLLMGVISSYAPIQAVVVDFNEAIGNSLERTGVVGNTTETVQGLAQWVERLGREPSRRELRRFMRSHPSDRYHHLAAHEPLTINDRMLGHDVENVYEALDTSYDLIAADTGNSMDRETWAVTVQNAHQLVIPIVDKDSYDGAVKMMRTLIRWGGSTADLARNAIVVITNKGNELSKAKVRQYREDWGKQVTGGVFVVPHDKHQPADGLNIDSLSIPTLRAYTKAAAQITRALHSGV